MHFTWLVPFTLLGVCTFSLCIQFCDNTESMESNNFDWQEGCHCWNDNSLNFQLQSLGDFCHPILLRVNTGHVFLLNVGKSKKSDPLQCTGLHFQKAYTHWGTSCPQCVYQIWWCIYSFCQILLLSAHAYMHLYCPQWVYAFWKCKPVNEVSIKITTVRHTLTVSRDI